MPSVSTHEAEQSFDATRRIARVLDESGINARATLYDEALSLAKDGHLSAATERLRMLLVLTPNDGDAALLLGKVLASREQYQEAIGWFDTAAANGAVVPAGLREKVETSFHQTVEDAESLRTRLAARERGEITSLRGEAKRLRSDNAILEAEILKLRRRVQGWSSATAVLLGTTLALVVAMAFFEATEPPVDVQPESTVQALVEAPPAPVGEPVVERAQPAPTAVTKPPAPVTKANEAPKPVATQRTHRVRSGDTLGRIANRYYGTSGRWPEIMKANKDVLHGSEALQVGMQLVIP